MKAVIIHADGRCTDLSRGVDPDTYAELENTSYSSRRPALWCGSCGGTVYIRHGMRRKDELFGAHHQAGSCAARLVIRPAGMSDEHKRQAEYQALAAQHAGHDAELEVTTTGRTRVDMVIDGTVGIEVQRSALSKAAAMDRTARSVAAGLRSVTWFTALTSDPQWLGHVPGYRTTTPMNLWKHLPKLRTAMAAGLRIIEAVRCGERRPCPHSRGTCPRYVPWDEPWRGLLVDDVVEGLAAGLVRPVRLGRNVQLLSTASISLYEELAGKPLSYDPGQPTVALLPSDRQECDRGFRVPDDAPDAVRAWFDAEQDRVRLQREERARALLAEQLRIERAQRERESEIQRRDQLVQEMRARARAVRDQQEREQEERRQLDQAEGERLAAVEGCPVPHRNFREQPMTRIEAAAVSAWYAREMARAAAAGPPACASCGQPGRLYAAGSLCDQHKSGSKNASAGRAE